MFLSPINSATNIVPKVTKNRYNMFVSALVSLCFPSSLFLRRLRRGLLVLVHLGGVNYLEYPLASPGLLNAGNGICRRHARLKLIQSCRFLFLSTLGAGSFLFHLKTIFEIGCTSQTTGMRLFKLGGPGRDPVACDISKNNEPSIVTGRGGW